MSTDKNSSNSGRILLILLLLGSIAFNVYQWNNHTETVVTYTNEVDSLINVRVAVERELASTEMELEKYRGIAGNLDSLLNDANQTISNQEKRIHDLLKSEKDTRKLSKKLKKELEELKKLRDEYLEKIDALMAENKELKARNDSLTQQVGDLSIQKNELQQKVNTASQLKIEYVKVTSYKKKSSGKLVESALAKKTNKIDVCFTLMDNKIATAGDHMVYLQIVAPNGKPLMGYTKAEMTPNEGEKIDMTSSQKIAYTGDKQSLCLAYESDERILESGTYSIHLYIDGNEVYNSNYVLR